MSGGESEARMVVVHVTEAGGGATGELAGALAGALAERGAAVVLVTSGAIAPQDAAPGAGAVIDVDPVAEPVGDSTRRVLATLERLGLIEPAADVYTPREEEAVAARLAALGYLD